MYLNDSNSCTPRKTYSREFNRVPFSRCIVVKNNKANVFSTFAEKFLKLSIVDDFFCGEGDRTCIVGSYKNVKTFTPSLHIHIHLRNVYRVYIFIQREVC